MRTKIVEATNGMNYGKFMLGVFDVADDEHRSALPGYPSRPLLRSIGYWQPERCLWIFDLQTREGAMFFPDPAKDATHDLDKHQIWVCPMFEHFVREWVYPNAARALALDVPDCVELSTTFFAFAGYRRGLVERWRRYAAHALALAGPKRGNEEIEDPHELARYTTLLTLAKAYTDCADDLESRNAKQAEPELLRAAATLPVLCRCWLCHWMGLGQPGDSCGGLPLDDSSRRACPGIIGAVNKSGST